MTIDKQDFNQNNNQIISPLLLTEHKLVELKQPGRPEHCMYILYLMVMDKGYNAHKYFKDATPLKSQGTNL